jgi:hypothetical protein
MQSTADQMSLIKSRQDTHPWGAMKVDSASHVYNGQIAGLCADCTVLAAQGEIAFENGTTADLLGGVYSHHIMLSMTGKPPVSMTVQTTCKGKPTAGFGGIAPSGKSAPASANALTKTVDGLLKSYFPRGKSMLQYVPSPFIVNGGDGSMVELRPRRRAAAM